MSHETVPALDQLIADPSQASGLSLAVLVALQTRGAAALTVIAAAISEKALQGISERSQQTILDCTLDADQIAAALGVSRRWVFRNSKTLPFVRRISRKALVCSEAALRRWKEAQKY